MLNLCRYVLCCVWHPDAVYWHPTQDYLTGHPTQLHGMPQDVPPAVVGRDGGGAAAPAQPANSTAGGVPPGVARQWAQAGHHVVAGPAARIPVRLHPA